MTIWVDSPGTVLISTLLDILALDFGIRHSGTFPTPPGEKQSGEQKSNFLGLLPKCGNDQ